MTTRYITPAAQRDSERAAAPAIWKPTHGECKAIRAAASIECRKRGLKLEPGTRFNTESDRGSSMNIAMVSDDPDWNDTDLHDHSSWAEFRKGVPLTADGRAIVDFYCYSIGENGELESNVTAYYADGRITLIQGTERRELPLPVY